MQKETPNKLYEKLESIIPKNVLTKQNKTRKWKYGYNSTYNIIIISKTGQIGDIISINGLDIALPLSPVFSRTRLKKQNLTILGSTRISKNVIKNSNNISVE